MASATELDNPDTSDEAKAFVPLENNPEVMTELTHSLGLSRTLAFTDVYSLSDPSLLSMVPRPSLALLLVFPISSTYETHRRAEDASTPFYDACGPKEPVVWFQQTIKNACGLIGLLHAMCNGPEASYIEPDSALAKLLSEALPLRRVDRAELLYESRALESAHADAAAKGDSRAPEANEEVELHYVCFVKSHKDGHLYELDGRRRGPLDRGALAEDEDVLSEEALERGPRAFLGREEAAGQEELRFSLVSLGPSWDD